MAISAAVTIGGKKNNRLSSRRKLTFIVLGDVDVIFGDFLGLTRNIFGRRLRAS